MKTRLGFVSNSSSSSFAIIGVTPSSLEESGIGIEIDKSACDFYYGEVSMG